MAILHFTDSDKLKSKVIEADYYPMRVKGIESKPSSSKKSINHFVTFEINDGLFNGKEFTVAFNTETSRASVLGGMQFVPVTTFMELAAATMGISIDAVPADVDTDHLVGGTFDGKVEKGIFDGIVMNTVMTYLPLGQGKQVEALPF